MVPALMLETLNCIPIERRQLVDQDEDEAWIRKTLTGIFFANLNGGITMYVET